MEIAPGPPPSPEEYASVITKAIEAARPPWYERAPWSFGIGYGLAMIVGATLKFLGWN